MGVPTLGDAVSCYPADGDLWSRRDFELRQRSYERETVCDLLAAAGFGDMSVVTLEEDEDGQPLRWLFRAGKAVPDALPTAEPPDGHRRRLS